MNAEKHIEQLKKMAEEIRAEGHAGWGNTCEQIADELAELDAEASPVKAPEYWKEIDGDTPIDTLLILGWLEAWPACRWEQVIGAYGSRSGGWLHGQATHYMLPPEVPIAIKSMLSGNKEAKSHRWDGSGERCLDCGDKDWIASAVCGDSTNLSGNKGGGE